MEIINRKYYEGYEGEGEIQFIRHLSNGDKYVIRIWDGYFDEIMGEYSRSKTGGQVWHIITMLKSLGGKNHGRFQIYKSY